MGFENPPWSWSELEDMLSDRRGRDGRPPGSPSWNAGGDGPAWGRSRQRFEPPSGLTTATGSDGTSSAVSGQPGVPYAELHCHSNYSFLTGASHPEELAIEAARLGLDALAVTDRNGLYGVVRFAEAAKAVGLSTIFGAEITLTPGLAADARVARSESATTSQVATGQAVDAHVPDPPGRHLVVLAEGPAGYGRLSRALALGHLAGEKGAPQFTLADLADGLTGGLAGGSPGDGSTATGAVTGAAAWVLTGGAGGVVPAALVTEGPLAARRELERLVAAFGRDRVLVELWDHGDPLDSARNDALVEVAARVGVECVATNHVHYAVPAQRRLATALAAVRTRRSLDELDPWLPGGAGAHLRSGAEQARRFARYPGVVQRAAEIGGSAAFDLSLVAPKLPPFRCPPGPDGRPLTEMAHLRQLVEEGFGERYGGKESEDQARRTIERELAVIDQLGYAGYFLVVWDLAKYCRDHGIYCQGRGSAANSAVCYALKVTAADPVELKLLFERFLAPERDGPPDIDIDIEAGRREEVIQYVYAKYGRHHTAQVANVITYRARSAVRDMARALGHAPGQQDAWAKQIDGWGNTVAMAAQAGSTVPGSTIPDQVLELATQVEDAPRHLGIHSGGMVICDRPVIEVCPVEWARKERRSVLQWDKDDCAAVELIKFDLLGLGMLSMLHGAVDLISRHRDREIDIAQLPQEDAVYAMLCRADTIGVFQIESRAQMGTLPRLKPREFYDLVVEVALIRPGPIQGGSVHPYIRRRNGQEEVTYLHGLLRNSLERTLGVPLFQEQLMQMAIDVAGFTPAEADQLRQAMGSKRSDARMEGLRERLYAGMAERDITGDVADEIFAKMKAFANFGFPESHAASFAYLVYASAWIKHHEPAAFCAALLNAQPMGFWSPHTLVRDARRHGVVVRTPDLAASQAGADLEDRGTAVRMGLRAVRGIGVDLAERIVAERGARGPYRDPEDLVRRVPELTLAQLEALAVAGTFGECFGLARREALWTVGAVAQSRPGRLPGVVTGERAPRLPGMAPVEEAVADLWATGISPDGHPTQFLRADLDRRGVITSVGLCEQAPGSRVVVAGIVTHRQRPMTAQGTTFLNLEDETGLINVVVSKGCWARHRTAARSAPALVVRGRLERAEGVTNVVAEHLAPLPVPGSMRSRDFR